MTLDSNLDIILDIDGTIADFSGGFKKKFKKSCSELTSRQISRRVVKLRTRQNVKFWTGLDVIDRQLDFTPRAYCTARINSKYSTKKWLRTHNLPDAPVYQVFGHGLSKVPQIKRASKPGNLVVLVDDDWIYVEDCLKKGIPALLIDSPSNQHIETNIRIYDLQYKTIKDAYKRLYF